MSTTEPTQRNTGGETNLNPSATPFISVNEQLTNALATRNRRRQNNESHFPNEEFGEEEDNQGEYASIRDSFMRIKLPGQFHLGDTSFPCSGEARRVLNIIKKSAGILQTSLRVLREADDRGAVADDTADNLMKCLTHHIRFLQTETQACMFEGSGIQKDGLRLIRSCSRSDYFSERDVRAVEFATAIQNCAKASDREHPRFNTRRRFGGYNRNFRSGSFRGGNNSYTNRDRDNFDGVVSQATKL